MSTNELGSLTQSGPGLSARGERRYVRNSGGRRFLLFTVTAPQVLNQSTGRSPVDLALVIDRSGSMHGDKMNTAKQAALAVLHKLDDGDHVTVVAFDEHIDCLHPRSRATTQAKSAIREKLHTLDARGSTALHEAWLVGCKQIAADVAAEAPARCFVLTDGQANIGEVEPEKIASQASGILENTGICTSTFGIGDYNEHLLAPMALAGGGQFHHLRNTGEIANTFLGELGEMMSITARAVRLELKTHPRCVLEMVSDYKTTTSSSQSHVTYLLGDLSAGEVRQLVLRLSAPASASGENLDVRARLMWKTQGGDQHGDWHTVGLSYASDTICDAERSLRDADVMYWAGLHTSYRAQIDASKVYAGGDPAQARALLHTTAQAVAAMAPASPALRAAAAELAGSEASLGEKEMLYQATRRQRGRNDLRAGSEPT